MNSYAVFNKGVMGFPETHGDTCSRALVDTGDESDVDLGQAT
jgi:hypothetical protein